jgi:hypothetical protein
MAGTITMTRPTARRKERQTTMWAFLSRRFRTWALLVVGVPVSAWVLDTVADRMEESRGETDMTRGLHGAGSWLRQRSGRGDQRRR